MASEEYQEQALEMGPRLFELVNRSDFSDRAAHDLIFAFQIAINLVARTGADLREFRAGSIKDVIDGLPENVYRGSGII